MKNGNREAIEVEAVGFSSLTVLVTYFPASALILHEIYLVAPGQTKRSSFVALKQKGKGFVLCNIIV